MCNLLKSIECLLFEKQYCDFSILDLFIELKGHKLVEFFAYNDLNEEVSMVAGYLCDRIEKTLNFNNFI